MARVNVGAIPISIHTASEGGDSDHLSITSKATEISIHTASEGGD